IHAWILLAQTLPGIVRRRHILRRVVASQLIVAASIGWPYIEVLALLPLLLHAKSTSDKSARVGRRPAERRTSHVHFNGPVFKIRAREDRDHVLVAVVSTWRWHQMHRAAPFVRNRLGLATDHRQILCAIETKASFFRVARQRKRNQAQYSQSNA